MMKTPIRHIRLDVISLAIVFLAASASAQSKWNAASGNWSTAANWSPAVVPTAATNVVFTNNVGAPTTAGTVDNTVDLSFGGAVASLQFAQNTNNAGVVFYHAMQIASGQTLTVSNGLTVGTLTDGVGSGPGTNVNVNTWITGAGGTLALTGGNLVVNQASAQAGAHLAILNMTNLDTFTATIGRLQVGVANGVNRAEGNLFLAKTNVITLSGSAPQLYMGFNNGNNNGGNNFPVLQLGLSNVFFVDSITVSADKQGNPASRLLFNPVFTNSNPYAYFRGTNGSTSRVSSWILGNNNGQASTSSTSDGTNDFSNGTLDAMVNSMVIGISEKGAGATAGSGNGTFTFSAGTNNVNTLTLGERLCTAGNSVGNGTMNVNGTATLIVNNGMCLSFFTPGGNSVFGAGNLNINGGTVLAATITNGVAGGGNLANITMNGGTLGITSLLGSIGTVAAPLNTITFSDSILQMPISGLQTNVVATTINGGGTTNIINITSVPANVITYPAQFPLIAYTGLGGFNFGISNLPGTYQGFISNNTTTSTIDLVLTNGPTSISTLEWTGSAGANWDMSSLNWLNGAAPVAYFDGASVLLDDNATGPTAVNIATLVSPASVTVSNNTLSYSFSGNGIGGSGSLTKYGTGTVLFTNSGNAFVGDITINAGTVQFGAGGTSGVLPPTGTVTDNGNLVIDHSNNHTLPNTISGTGTLTQSGSNVLSVTGSNSFSGTTLVNSGTLVLSGVLSGALNNALGSTVGGSGTNVGAVNVSGAIQPSAGTGIPTTFTSGDLNLSSGATLKFILNGANASVGSGINDLLQAGGNLSANNNIISLAFAGVPQTGVPYTLINFPSGTQSGTLSSTVAGTHFTASISQGSSPVTVTLSGSGANLKWAPGATNLWDVGTTSNWLNSASPDVFYAGDNVLFDDTVGVATNVIVGAGVAVYPNVITVNSANNNFVISGPGRISGPASIQKLGTSTLTLSSGANDFSNGTLVAAGTLKLGANGAAGAGTTYVTNGGTLDLNASTMAGSAVVSGTGVGANGAVVNSGFIVNGDQHAFDAGTTLYLAGDATISANNRWDIRNGSLMSFDASPWNLTLVGSNDFHLVNATVDPNLGNVDVQSGQFVIETTTIADSGGWAGDSTHSITIESGAELSLGPTGAAALSRAIALNGGSKVQNTTGNSVLNGPFTLTGNDTFLVTGGTLEIDSAMGGSGSLIAAGGLVKLGGANTYTNSTLVNAGTLSFTDSGSISNSADIVLAAGAVIDVSLRTDSTFALNSGQTLQGNGTITGSNLLVNSGATLSPGANSASIGTLTATNTATLGGTTLMKLNATSGTSDQLVASNGIACGGTIIVTNLSGTFTNGETFQLLVSTNFSGTFGSITLPSVPGLTWTNNLATTGTLIAGLATGPVPQPYITSISLSGTTLIINGTNGVAGEQYDVLASTNVAAPLSNWTSITSSTFNAGNFSITNTVTPGSPRQFFLLRIP